jgi:hypothetical protein
VNPQRRSCSCPLPDRYPGNLANCPNQARLAASRIRNGLKIRSQVRVQHAWLVNCSPLFLRPLKNGLRSVNNCCTWLASACVLVSTTLAPHRMARQHLGPENRKAVAAAAPLAPIGAPHPLVPLQLSLPIAGVGVVAVELAVAI